MARHVWNVRLVHLNQVPAKIHRATHAQKPAQPPTRAQQI